MVKGARGDVPCSAWRLGLCAALCALELSCGGGGAGDAGSSAASGSGAAPSGANVVAIVVDAGPTSTSPDVNTLFTTVTVCLPGTTSCQTIDHIQVDTASYGLRILASVLTIGLPVQTVSNGGSLLECTQFVDGYSWGPVALADVQISGETAGSVPVQVIGAANFSNVPAACSSTGTAEDTVAQFGANGLLGVGVFAQDCGSACAGVVDNGNYYACTSTQCQPTTAALASQVVNPITLFPADNNGVVIQLPSVAAQGAATLTGYLIFGIDTQANNKSGSQSVLTLDPNTGFFETNYGGQTLTQSFLDTGSNAFFFNDSSIVKCTDPNLDAFYCPAGAQSPTATLEGQNAASATLTFSVGNAETLLSNEPNFAVFPGLAGPYIGATATFDWGLPFFLGRTVYSAVENATTAVGTGPYVAF